MAHGDILSASGLTGRPRPAAAASPVHSPIDGSAIAKLKTHGGAEGAGHDRQGVTAFRAWRQVPAPRRGELVASRRRRCGGAKESPRPPRDPGMRQILQEGMAKCRNDRHLAIRRRFSRSLYGLTIAWSARGPAMRETWHIPSASAGSSPPSTPSRPLRLECGLAPGLRRSRDLETLRRRRSSRRSPSGKLLERGAVARFGGPGGSLQIVVGEGARRARALVTAPMCGVVSANRFRPAWARASPPKAGGAFRRAHSRARAATNAIFFF